MTKEEIRELAYLEKTCGTQPYYECEGGCLDPDEHETAKKKCLDLRKQNRRWERSMNAYASST